MKLLIINHKNLNYEFRLLEQSSVVEIYKESIFTYLIDLSTKLPKCDCPGAIYHKKCWHPEMLPLLNNQESIKEPWALWCEEAGGMKYVKY